MAPTEDAPPTATQIRNARLIVWFMAGLAVVSLIAAFFVDGGGRALCILFAGLNGSMAALGATGPYYRGRDGTERTR